MRTKIAVLFALCLAGAAVAQPTEWWNQAYGNMQERDKASSWKAESGDTLSGLVNKTYKVPLNKMTTINRVIDAIIAYNNAMAGQPGSHNANKVTLITNRDLIFAGKNYFLPDPESIDKIMRGGNPAEIVAQSLSNASNKSHADGNPDGMPSHGSGDINVAGADGDVAPPPGPGGGTTPPGGGVSVDPQALGDWGDRTSGVVSVIGVRSDPGPQLPPGSTATAPETAEELRSNGGSEGNWMLQTMTATYNARAYGVVTEGALRAGVDAGITNR